MQHQAHKGPFIPSQSYAAVSEVIRIFLVIQVGEVKPHGVGIMIENS